jgi:hypothetical protein
MTRRTSHTRAPLAKIPKLQVTTITVRPRGRALVYAADIRGELMPIPNGVWSTIPVSADVMIAIKHGDLERKPEGATRSKPAPADAATAGKRKADKARAVADVEARMKGGETQENACRAVYHDYGYAQWDTLARACRADRSGTTRKASAARKRRADI